MFENIVVAVDGSEPSNHALKVACDLANHYGSSLHLVHSPQLETVGHAVGSAAIEIKPNRAIIEEAGHKVVDKAMADAKEMGCTSVDSTIGFDDPAEDILRTLKLTDADLVVMGRRGLGRLTSAILGSVSQKVSHDADCSCLTVH